MGWTLEVSRTLIANGVERLAVATIDEAILLRENGINVPVQILGAILEEDAQKVIDYDIIPTVPSVKQAAFLSSIAVKCGKKLRIHIKVDTGMGRLGFFPDSDGIKQVTELARLPKLRLEA